MPFQNEHLSFSRLSRYEQCPLAFKLHYVDRLEAAPGLPLLFGKAIHAALEKLLAAVVAQRLNGPLDVGHALRLWNDQWLREGGLHGIDVFQDGVTILRDFCRDEGAVRHEDVIGVEREFDLMIGRFRVVGALDRVNRLDAETVEIVDYKSNRILFTRAEVDSSLQMSLYALAAAKLWPWAKNVRLTFHMLRHSIRMETTRSPEQLETAKAYVAALGEQIEHVTDFPARLNPNCAYCDHKAQCPTFAEALKGKRWVVAADLGDLGAVAQEREEVAAIAKLAYARKGELEEVLRTQIEKEGEVSAGGRKYSLFTIANTTYPFEATVEQLVESTGMARDEVLRRVATIEKGKIDDFLKDARKTLPRSQVALLRAEVDGLAERRFSQRFSSKGASS
jgi:putative RecB family exonuclease